MQNRRKKVSDQSDCN